MMLTYYLLIYFLGGILSVFAGKKIKYTIDIFSVYTISFVFHVIAILFNESFHFFAQKGAGDKAIWTYNIWKQSGSFDIFESFFIQTIINFPGFYVFEANRWIVLGTNAFIGSAVAIIVFYYISRLLSYKAALVTSILCVIYPAAFNFSIFGLRDIMIYFFIFLYHLSLLYIFLIKDKHIQKLFNIFLFIISFFSLYSLRPEFLPVLVVLPFMISYKYLNKYFIKKISDIYLRYFIFITSNILFFFILFIILANVYFLVLSNIGINGYVSPIDILTTSAESRFTRAELEVGQGGGSHILPQSIYLSLPWYGRWTVQTMSMFIVPMPWLLINTTRWLAFIDTLFVFALLYYVCKKHKFIKVYFKHTSLYFCYKWVLISFFAAMLLMGMVVTNAGNAFRMRVEAIPLLIISVSFIYHFLNQYKLIYTIRKSNL